MRVPTGHGMSRSSVPARDCLVPVKTVPWLIGPTGLESANCRSGRCPNRILGAGSLIVEDDPYAPELERAWLPDRDDLTEAIRRLAAL